MKLWTIIKGGIAASGLVALLALPTIASANCDSLIGENDVTEELIDNFQDCSELPRPQCLACCAQSLAAWLTVSGAAQLCEQALVARGESIDRLFCQAFEEGKDRQECIASQNAEQKEGTTDARDERKSQRDQGLDLYDSCRSSCEDSGE